MKSLTRHLGIIVLLISIFALMIGCSPSIPTSSKPSVFIVANHKEDIVFGEVSHTMTDIARGKLLYAEAQGDKIISTIMDKEGSFKILITDLTTGETTATTILPESKEKIAEIMPEKTNSGTWILIPWDGVAVLVDKEGHILFNSHTAYPNGKLTWSDSEAMYPLHILEDGSAWLMLTDKGNKLHAVYVSSQGKVEKDIDTGISGEESPRFGLLKDNIAIGYKRGGWQIKIFAPDGKVVLSTENIADYGHGFTMSAGAGHPVTAIRNGKMLIPYIDKESKMHLLMIDSIGNIVYNKVVDIPYNESALDTYILNDGSLILINNVWNGDATLYHIVGDTMYTASVPDAWGYIELGHIGIIQPSKPPYGGVNWFYIYHTDTHKVEKIDGKNPEMLALLKHYGVFTTVDGGIFAISEDGNITKLDVKGKMASMLYHKSMHKCSGISRCLIVPVPEIYFVTNDGISNHLYRLQDDLKLTQLYEGAPVYISDSEPFTFVAKPESGDISTYIADGVEFTYDGKEFKVSKAPEGTHIYIFASNDYPYLSLVAVIQDRQVIYSKWLMPDGGSYSTYSTQSDKEGIYSVFVGANVEGESPGGTFVYVKRK